MTPHVLDSRSEGYGAAAPTLRGGQPDSLDEESATELGGIRCTLHLGTATHGAERDIPEARVTRALRAPGTDVDVRLGFEAVTG